MKKRLYRSRENKVLGGVCGGIGEYFDVDPVLIRLLYLLATVFTAFGPGLIGYIIAMIVVPEAPLVLPQTPAPAAEPVPAETASDDAAAV